MHGGCGTRYVPRHPQTSQVWILPPLSLPSIAPLAMPSRLRLHGRCASRFRVQRDEIERTLRIPVAGGSSLRDVSRDIGFVTTSLEFSFRELSQASLAYKARDSRDIGYFGPTMHPCYARRLRYVPRSPHTPGPLKIGFFRYYRYRLLRS